MNVPRYDTNRRGEIILRCSLIRGRAPHDATQRGYAMRHRYHALVTVATVLGLYAKIPAVLWGRP